MFIDYINKYLPYGMEGLVQMCHEIPGEDITTMLRCTDKNTLLWFRESLPDNETYIHNLLRQVLDT